MPVDDIDASPYSHPPPPEASDLSVATAAALVAAHAPSDDESNANVRPLLDSLNRHIQAPNTHMPPPVTAGPARAYSARTAPLDDAEDQLGLGSGSGFGSEPGARSREDANANARTDSAGRNRSPSSSRKNSSGASTAVPNEGASCSQHNRFFCR